MSAELSLMNQIRSLRMSARKTAADPELKIKSDAESHKKFLRAKYTADVLGLLMGTLENAVKDTKTYPPNTPMDDAGIVATVIKMIKGIDESLNHCPQDANDPTMYKLLTEKSVLENFIPTQMTEAEILAFAMTYPNPDKNLGVFMTGLKNQFGGRYDGKMASSVIKNYIKQQTAAA